jgi:hypothetical protein
MRWEHDSLSAACWEYDTLSTIWSSYQANSGATGGYKKNNNRQYRQSPIYNFGQKHLNVPADQSAAKDGWVLPHFQQIVSGALMPPHPMAAVI